jgi:DNA-binding transcriptional ArsR family regulator
MPDVIDLKLLAKFFRGLGDESRLNILEVLREGPKNVTEIVQSIGLGQSNTSLHLECLYCCGLVDRERKGRYMFYSIRSTRTLHLLKMSHSVLEPVAGHIRDCSRYRK